MNFKEKLQDVPTNPGVYLMLDKDGEIIYVGKAKNLRNRLRQYFYLGGNKTLKVMKMVENIVDFRYIITASEVDALVTENNLIKKYTPKYNILLKDDKSYPFIKIKIKEKYPTISIVRKLKNDGAKYFGPYMQSVNYHDILDLVHSAFKIRECTRNIDGKTCQRACLNFHLERCLAPCQGCVDEQTYHNEIDKVVSFLRGNDRQVAKILETKMKKFSDEGNYESAIVCRDKLKVLDKIVRKQISALPMASNIDVFALKSDGVNTVVSRIVVRGGKIVGGNNFETNAVDEDLSSYLVQHYKNNAPLCDEIVLDEIDDVKAMELWLYELVGRKINIVQPKQGIRAELLQMAVVNAEDALEKIGTKLERQEKRTVGAVKQLAEILDLKILPRRIEAFDISHISGTDKVSSMVVFENGEPRKSHYRKFKIKTVEGNNDFASMKETLKRRLLRLDSDDESFSTPPDLILIDGGMGQLSYAKEALLETGHDFQMISLAEKCEEIYLSNTAILLPKDSVALQLLQRVRDEAHRFAVTFHKTLRQKRMIESELLKIDGIGEKRAKAIMEHFGSISKIKVATIDELCAVSGMSTKVATNIHDYFLKQVAEDE